MLTELARTALVGHRRSAEAIELRFRRNRFVMSSLQHLIELESHCCAFLEFSLEEDADELVLCVAGPPGAEHVLTDLHRALEGNFPPS